VRKTLLLVALVALLTTGCIKADMKFEVNDDGSGTYSATFAVNAELLQTMGGLAALDPDAEPDAGSSGDICKDMVTDAQEETPTGGKVEAYKDGDFCGVRISAPFADIEEALQLLESGGDTGGATLEDVTLEKDGNAWVFDATWNPSDTGATTGADAEMTKQFLQGFSFVIRMRLPGGQVDQNADLIEDDGTMVWNLDPSAQRTLTARTEPGAAVIRDRVQTDAGKNINSSAASASGAGDDDGGSKTWLWVVIGLVVVAIIVAIVLMKRSKTKPVPAMAGMPMGATDTMSHSIGAPVGGAPTATAPATAAASAQAPAHEPQWDAARNAYIQWDHVNNRWMQYDQAASTWKPIE
jgi:hypothetical protein